LLAAPPKESEILPAAILKLELETADVAKAADRRRVEDQDERVRDRGDLPPELVDDGERVLVR
jgi:hypothetical protein